MLRGKAKQDLLDVVHKYHVPENYNWMDIKAKLRKKRQEKMVRKKIDRIKRKQIKLKLLR